MPIAELSKILFYTSIIVWLIPPFRQYRERFFFYFLILALNDPIFLINNLIRHANFPIQINVLIQFLLLVSILQKNAIKKHKQLLVAIFILLLVMTFFGLNQSQNFVAVIIIHCGIFFIMLKMFITSYVQSGKVKLFYIALFSYELTVILKLLNVLLGFADAIGFFILTSIAQIIFGLFFSIYRENKTGITV